MTTYDFKQVREFADALNAQLDRCESEEGTQCATIETELAFYAECCCKFAEMIRLWRRDVFSGRVAFDPVTEQMWKAELSRLFNRALAVLDHGRRAEVQCYILDEQCKLEAAIWNLHRLLTDWTTPKRAVGPSARQELEAGVVAEAQRTRMASLSPLPSDWKPVDNRQRILFHGLRSQRSPIKNA